MSSGIEWTGETWSPLTGCKKVSPGCRYCYAEVMANRLKHMGRSQYAETTTPSGHWSGVSTFVTDALGKPLHWKKPRTVFVCSMSDLFFEGHQDDHIVAVLQVIAKAKHHTFQVLTKRPTRMRQMFTDQDIIERVRADHVPGAIRELTDWPLPNLHVGTSIENTDALLDRWEDLVRTPAAVRFVSAEPLLGPIGVELEARLLGGCSVCGGTAGFGTPDSPSCPCGSNWSQHPGVHWIIAGGESGPRARSCDPKWIREVVRICAHAGVGCFVKQLGAAWAKANGSRTAKGSDPEEWPEELRVRQEPIT